MKILLFANTEWYLYNFRRTLALALQDAGHEVLLLSPPGPYGEKLQALGLRWIPVPMARRSLNPFREMALVLWLRQLFRQERVDLVHGFTIKGAVYGSLAARLAGVSARVNGIDGLGYVFASNDFKAQLLRPLVRTMLQLALNGKSTRLILLNRDDVAMFQQSRLVDSALVRMIPGAGVDCKRFSFGGQRVVGQPLRVLMAARLLWDKGLMEYVTSARSLKAQGRQIQFLLAGTPDPGNPKSVSEETVQGWVGEGLINWLGHVSDMPALLATVHVVALPSYREGLPTTLTEAAACSLPLITSDVPGCRDVVTHEVDGLLIPVRDAEALAQAIARLDDDPVLAARLGAAAREKALELFEEQIVIKSTMAVYAELINEPAPVRRT
ncbi:MAG: glycosyltransferase family 4 protein [Candidatus Saccharibacteria bacterium]|nr:glycosyltransferase family 4 protein [Rhodoferax sp.]